MDPQGPHDSFDSPPARLADLLDDWVVWFERRRHLMPRALAVLVVAAIVLAAGWWVLRPRSAVSIEDRIPMVALEPSVPEAVAAPSVIVHVAGAVERPGVYEFADGERVVDAVNAAGGALADADLSPVNLAALLVDGSQIRIPLEGEQVAVLSLSGGGGGSDGGPVMLNRATATELERLPGVGPATAQAIITWRTENGPFVTVEQLMDVPGIGPAKFAAMADQVVVG